MSFIIFVLDIRKPKFITKPKSISTNIGNKEINLQCEAAGNPTPTITWSHNGISLALSPRHLVNNLGTLFIKDVVADDYGIYRCEASNPHGRISSTAEVIINGKTTMPYF